MSNHTHAFRYIYTVNSMRKISKNNNFRIGPKKNIQFVSYSEIYPYRLTPKAHNFLEFISLNTSYISSLISQKRSDFSPTFCWLPKESIIVVGAQIKLFQNCLQSVNKFTPKTSLPFNTKGENKKYRGGN